MINLTVKTLDSRNHQFSVNDDMTVGEFKRHIAESVNISAETQRIIFCGRVLQDSSKLVDHDLDGKAVHLVQRPPPGTTTPSNSSRSSRTTSPHPAHRLLRHLDTNNAAVIFGSVYGSNLDTQGVLHPPTHTHAFSRLNVARRMLRRALSIISQLENPSGPVEPAPQDDSQDEVLPIIEARLYYPGAHTAADESQVITQFFQHYLRDRPQNSGNATQNSGNASQGSENRPQSSGNGTQSSGNVPQRSGSTSQNTTANSGEQSTLNNSSSTASSNDEPVDLTFPQGATRTEELAELLTNLNQVQQRFAPFLERYQTFMREDPAVPSPEEYRKIQTELDRVSEVMHYLSHAYHSLSDVIVRARNPPPRALLTRPLMLQQSAFVQTRMGIPIQVEAQINLSDRTSAGTNSQPTSQARGANPQPASQARESATFVRPGGTTASDQPQHGFATQGVPVFSQVSSVRLPIPLEIRLPGLSALSSPRTAGAAREASGAATGAASATGTSATPIDLSTNQTGNRSSSSSSSNSFGSSDDVEILMEVTPEGISIDSTSQAEEFLRAGSINGQQPASFIHSMMQMASELFQGTGNASGSRQNSATGGPQQNSATSAPPLTPTPPAQNSQARGNNQTNPTSSTQTRSTPRPHVHLHHQNIPSGFDPYLPCHSHHVNRRRVQNESASSNAGQNQANAGQNQTNAGQNQSSGGQNQPTSPPNVRVTFEEHHILASDGSHERLLGVVNRLLEHVGIGDAPQNPEDVPHLTLIRPGPYPRHRRYALETVFGEYNFSGTYRMGDNICRDILMIIYGNLSLRDILRLKTGDCSSLSRLVPELRALFSRLSLESSSRRNEIVERVIRESREVISTMAHCRIWRNVDIEATLVKFLRAKLPGILELCAQELTTGTSDLTNLFKALTETVKQLGVLIYRACNKNAEGTQMLLRRLMAKHLNGLPEELVSWFAPNGYVCVTDFLQKNYSSVGPVDTYIVSKSRDNNSGQQVIRELVRSQEDVEPMEVDAAPVQVPNASEPSSSPQPSESVSEPLPNVVHGSQPWHSQVPADWVPIITRDVQTQKKSNGQAPFSDAYLSGMPSKRRKLVHNSKLRSGTPLPQVIAESVKKAVDNTGLSAVAPLETVSRRAGTSQEIQNAYRTLLRTSVQQELRENPDFNPERFPNAASYFLPK